MKSTKMQTNIFLFILFIFCLNFCVCKKYYNYTLFRGIPVEEEHMEYYQNLSRLGDINYWREPGLMYKPVDFVVGPESKPVFLAEAEKLGLYVTTLLEDVQKAFDMQTVKTYIRRNMDTFDWNNFFRLDDIYQWLTDLGKANPLEMSIQSIGKTIEKREIMAVRIVLKGSKRRSTVIIEGGIHAREWISPAFVTYLIHEIIHASTSNNAKLKEIAMTYEWYFVPVLNPDGYEYSHTTDRQWRKNRNLNGVDLNRNFDVAFGTVGISSQKAADTYCGPSAFSERESKAMRNFVKSKRKNLEYYFAFHSYGQYMIIPYAHSKKHEENFEEVKVMCQQAATQIARRYRTKYSIGTAYDTVGYMTSGVSGCWVKSTFHVPYVLTFELRDDGFYGFALPPQKIMPTCKETMDGLLALLTPKIKDSTKSDPRPLKHTSGYVVTFELRDQGIYGFALPPEQIKPTCLETLKGLISLLTPQTPQLYPPTTNFTRQYLKKVPGLSGPHFVLDNIVLIFNVCIFIVARFN